MHVLSAHNLLPIEPVQGDMVKVISTFGKRHGRDNYTFPKAIAC